MKSLRFHGLLASTALGLVLMTGQPGMAQQTDQQKIDAAIPVPDTTLPPPPTIQDIAPAQAAPAALDSKPAEAKQEAAAPAAEPAKAEPAKAEAPKATVTADSAISDKLRELIASKQFDRIVNRKSERTAIEAFYNARNFAPLWVANGAANARAESAIKYLKDAESVGLDASQYPTPDFASTATPDAIAEAELKLIASALTFARHAQIGRVHYTRVAGDITFNLVAPEPADVLSKLAANDDAAKTLDSFNPPMPEFKALKAKLAELRNNGGQLAKPEEKKVEKVRVPDGKILRLGMKDERVMALRKRLDIPGDKNNTLYDNQVRDAVHAFQLSAELGADGNVGPATIRALNGEQQKGGFRRASHNPIDTIIVNMERWRWYARDLGNPHVVVNIPDYTLTLWNNDKVYWHTRIVTGTPRNATPLISAEMKFITVNPTWNVPPSIIENEYLPALQQDPQALERIGLKVEQAADGTVRIYQPPGAGNALGRIRFNFPNKYLVYQHDTPDKHLFAKEERAYSHGCMRVQNPFTYAEKLLSLTHPNERYSEARIQSMLGTNEININFPKPLWVHLTYQTAFVDQDGTLQLRKDIYGRDARMIAILKSSEMKVADLPIERAPNTSSKPVRMPVGTFGGNRYDNGGNFFDWIFGGGARQQEVPRPRGAVGPRAETRRPTFR